MLSSFYERLTKKQREANGHRACLDVVACWRRMCDLDVDGGVQQQVNKRGVSYSTVQDGPWLALEKVDDRTGVGACQGGVSCDWHPSRVSV